MLAVLQESFVQQHYDTRNSIILSDGSSASPDQIVLAAGTLISLVLVVGQVVISKLLRFRAPKVGQDLRHNSNPTQILSPVNTIYNSLRFIACVGLLALQLRTTPGIPLFIGLTFADILCANYIYISCLAFHYLLKPLSQLVSLHLTILLLLHWSVFAYRDLWPLATFTTAPRDASEGSILWVKLATLTLTAVIVPLVQPRPYVPYDPKTPMQEPNAEQTASILSRTLYLYMDAVALSAYKSASLSAEQLPALCDSDDIRNLVTRTYKELDPLQSHTRRHIFWSLLKVFSWEHVELTGLLVIMVLAYFMGPVGVNRLLAYVEMGGQDAYVKPWFWALWLAVGNLGVALISGRYMLVMARLITQTQGILTQLIFDHTMQVRTNIDRGDASSPTDISDSGTRKAVDPNTSSSTCKTFSAGNLNNLIATDITNLDSGQYWILTGFFTPVQILVSVVFLYIVLGWSSLVGIATLALLLPVPGLITKRAHDIQVGKMQKSDARLEAVTEVMGGALRMVKMFGWETQIGDRIDRKRQEELRAQRKYKLVTLVNNLVNRAIPIASMVVTYVVYTLVMKQKLTASRAFSSVTVFQWLQEHFRGASSSLPGIINAKVSLDRINSFLQNADLVDPAMSRRGSATSDTEAQAEGVIGIREAVFTWNQGQEGSETTTTNRSYRLTIEEEVIFTRGKINLIIGQSGSGKTSFLMALLGEMYYVPTGPTSFVSLPRAGGVAYHAQESWILNDSIRNNILFGQPYEESRYQAVLKQCALESDLALFSARDYTEVGERGVTLSGGQKARVTLARAIYSTAEILLLDDVLAALDAHTAQWIVKECLLGDLVKDRTVILATHNLALTTPIAHFVVALTLDGRISSQGNMESVLQKDSDLVVLEKRDQESLIEVKEQPSGTGQGSDIPEGAKLIADEEVLEGHVGWSAVKLLLTNMSSSPWGLTAFWIGFLIPALGTSTSSILYTWVLGLWARQYDVRKPEDVAVPFYLLLYVGAVGLTFINLSMEYTVFTFGSLHAVQVIHRMLVNSVLRSTLRWLDTTPSSRIIARCTQDISSIEGPVLSYFYDLVDFTWILFLRFCAIIYMSPFYTIPSLLLGFVGGCIGQIYIIAQLSVKREMSNARAPILGHFGAVTTGIVSIRAYGAQHAFEMESRKRINRYTRASRNFGNLNRWIAIRSEGLAATFYGGLAAYLVYGGSVDASGIGFTLAMAATFSNLILWWVKYFNEFEVSGNSLERIQQYLNIEHEPSPTASGVPPAYWPASGKLKVENLSARYSENGPNVLQDVSFEINSGERVGIVGRTGSGKTSLTLALLRCILTEGKVYFDGLPIDQINLDALRTAITIIPQVPELLSGTLRDNVDPLSQHDDAYLNEALGAAGLFSLNRDTMGERLSLDSLISSAGKNLSVGQRQMIALARALVRRSRLLILDEATSAIDYETDAIIQASLGKVVQNDVSVLTVAHRLQTVMDSDKIMVLDAGRVVEFGKPAELLANKEGLLYALVDASPDRTKLLATVKDYMASVR